MGMSGGLLIAGKSDIWDGLSSSAGQNHICCTIIHKSSNRFLRVYNIYGPPKRNDKNEFFLEVKRILRHSEVATLVGGEFSMTCGDTKSYYEAEHVYRKQQKKVKWLKDGDRNTKFFHRVATGRKQKKWISSIVANGGSVNQPKDIALAFNDFFRLSIGTQSELMLRLNWSELFLGENFDLSDLTTPFGNEKILAGLKDMGKNKAQGLDGLTPNFFIAFWDIIGEEVILVIEDIREGRVNLSRINKSFIVPIPKTKGANKISDFRPISLTSSIVKIFSKLMAIRLKPHRESLIGNTQSAFLSGRSTLDSFMAVFELIRFCKRQNMDAIILKLDLSKAFDCVDWDFLLELLRERGFLSNWGDSLFSYLFLLVTDVFARMMNRATHYNLIKGVKMDEELQVSHLEFAEDFVVFTCGDEDDLLNLKILLLGFELMIGLKANLAKIEVLHVTGNDIRSAEAAAILGCKQGAFPLKYLGLPLREGRLLFEDWNGIIEKVDRRLTS
ncbi:hypothetical protein Cni_G09289 [Canna indica]|uniref:Reverse transcriptase domain-containing protein n=1 Tax=Canna indica TaxID=4628 RepID=A0AAQ3Q6C9_9LILI|nr:hypothetical protein Cni_G09289 [Canna indica]